MEKHLLAKVRKMKLRIFSYKAFAISAFILLVFISHYFFQKRNHAIFMNIMALNDTVKNYITSGLMDKDLKKGISMFVNLTSDLKQQKLDQMFEVKLKPGLMSLINPTVPKYALTINGSYHLQNKNFCTLEKSLTVLIMVLSAPSYVERRNVIRGTWGNSSFYSDYGTVKIMFVLGVTENQKIQEEIEAEFKSFGDILQGSVLDSYHNLSHKSVLSFKWLSERCRNAKYVIKTDDDVVLNLFRIFETDFPSMSIDKYHVHCERRTRSPVIRQKNEKPYVEPHQLRGLKYHMPYCHGQYVMFINEIVPFLYKSASITPFFWIDDVFNYGIVMNNIPGLKYKQVYQYTTYENFIKKGAGRQRRQDVNMFMLFQRAGFRQELFGHI